MAHRPRKTHKPSKRGGVRLGISRKVFSEMGQSGAAIEKEYALVSDDWFDSDVHIPNERREAAAFTPDILRVANVLTLKDDTHPVGGFKFRVFRCDFFSLLFVDLNL
jgi:hypothetical protein